MGVDEPLLNQLVLNQLELYRTDITPDTGTAEAAAVLDVSPPARVWLLCNLPYPPAATLWVRNDDICQLISVSIHNSNPWVFQCLLSIYLSGARRKPTERLDRGTAVNRCRAMTGTKPRPFKLDDPPNICTNKKSQIHTAVDPEKKSSTARRDSCSNGKGV